MKRKIKIKFTDGAENYGKDIVINWLKAEKYSYDITDSPDYVVFGPHGYECLDFPDSVKIFFTCEDISPDFNICDYAVGFDDIMFGDRYLKYPSFLEYKNDINLIPYRKEEENIRQKLSQEVKFCSFTVSNGKGDINRKSFFDFLSNYKKIESGGKYSNNIGYQIDNKLDFDKQHKFSITFENASHKGYTTEKILQGFAAGLIPIYWGDPDVGEYFNKNTFINVMDYETWNEVLNKIIELDNNDEQYIKMLRESVFNKNFIPENYYAELDSFLQNIFYQPLSSAKRTSRVFWNKMYNERLLKMRKFRDMWYRVKYIFKKS